MPPKSCVFLCKHMPGKDKRPKRQQCRASVLWHYEIWAAQEFFWSKWRFDQELGHIPEWPNGHGSKHGYKHRQRRCQIGSQICAVFCANRPWFLALHCTYTHEMCNAKKPAFEPCRPLGMVQKDANLGNTFSSFLRWGCERFATLNCNTNDCQNGALI